MMAKRGWGLRLAFFTYLLSLAAPSAVLAGSASNPTPGTNIFTPPNEQQNEVPSFKNAANSADRLKKMMMGEGLPDLRLVRSLPSLSASQRKEISEIFDQSRAPMEALQEQLRTLREKNPEAKDKGGGDPQARETIQQLRNQIKDLRTQTWEKAKLKLTDDQLDEMERMRHGKMQPTTFNQPVFSGKPPESVGGAETGKVMHDEDGASMYRMGDPAQLGQ